MLDEIDRRAEQEAVAVNTLRKYQITTPHKPILYNNVARAGTMPSTIIKRRITKPRVKTERKSEAKKQIPVFSLED